MYIFKYANKYLNSLCRSTGPPTLLEGLTDKKVKIGEIVELSVTGRILALIQSNLNFIWSSWIRSNSETIDNFKILKNRNVVRIIYSLNLSWLIVLKPKKP